MSDENKAEDGRTVRAAKMKAERDAAILEAAIACARAEGYQWITREMVATKAGVSVGSVNNAFGRMVKLKRAVLQAAVDRAIPEIVAQGLADGHEIARNAPLELRQRAAATVLA